MTDPGRLAEADQHFAAMREAADRLVHHLGAVLDECDGDLMKAFVSELPMAVAGAVLAGQSTLPLALLLGLMVAEERRKEGPST